MFYALKSQLGVTFVHFLLDFITVSHLDLKRPWTRDGRISRFSYLHPVGYLQSEKIWLLSCCTSHTGDNFQFPAVVSQRAMIAVNVSQTMVWVNWSRWRCTRRLTMDHCMSPWLTVSLSSRKWAGNAFGCVCLSRSCINFRKSSPENVLVCTYIFRISKASSYIKVVW